MNPIGQYLWTIPAAPFVASLLILCLVHKRRAVIALAITGQICALILAVVAFGCSIVHAPGWRSFYNFAWFTVGEMPVRIGWLLDPLTAVMLLMIAFVSLCIFVFSVGSMSE
jgi:NADH-quinone oxidoreductase subunit L